MSQVVTGEAVALDLRLARLPSRLLAAVLDLAVQFVALLAIGALAGRAVTLLNPAAASAVSLVLTLAVLLGYPVALETLWRGRTLGKAALGLRAVRDDGGPIGFRQALVRGLWGAFVERPGITLYFAAVVSMLLSERSKRIGDIMAGTVVLQERVPSEGGPVAMMPPPLSSWATQLDLSRLPDELALQVRQFLARAGDMTPAARESLGNQLVAHVAAVSSPPPPSQTPGWAYLSAVLAERRRREQQRLHPRPQPYNAPPHPAAPPNPAAPPGGPPVSSRDFTPPG